MKIYRKIILNLQGEVIKEDSYEYTGPIVECGSGGGGGSGKSDWPDYMKTQHQAWLGEMDAIIPVTNPYTGIVAYDPTTVIQNLDTYLTNYKGFHTAIGLTLTAFKSLWTGWVTTMGSSLGASVVADLDANAIPVFEAGMSDINAVQTSSFALGKAAIYGRTALETAKLTLLNVNQAVDLTMKYGESLRNRFFAELEFTKVVIIAYKEKADRQVELDIEEAKWIFFNYREAGALLGAIGGSAAMSGSAKPNPLASALGGAMTGAATGAAVTGGNPIGAVAGAVIGGIGGYLSAS